MNGYVPYKAPDGRRGWVNPRYRRQGDSAKNSSIIAKSGYNREAQVVYKTLHGHRAAAGCRATLAALDEESNQCE